MPGTFIPSRYQQEIFDGVDDAFATQRLVNILISAVAGSGKSSTLRELLAHIPPHLRVVFLTFGHDINEDQTAKVKVYTKARRSQKLPVAKASCMTIHSLGATCLHKIDIHGNPERGKRKYNRLCQEYLKANMVTYSYQLAVQLKALIDKVRVTLTDPTEENLIRLLQRFTDIDINPEEKEIWPLILKAVPYILEQGIQLAKVKGVSEIDFTDQIWLPSFQALKLVPNQYDVVLIDEAQDLSPCQRELVMKACKPGGMKIYVGDRDQCQPAGTKVLLQNNTECNIEDLKPGDYVVTYDRRSASFVKKGLVNAIASRHYDGLLYTITAGGKQSQCTDSHKWLVRWTDGEDAWVTYLMRKGDSYRVGQTQMFVHRNAEDRNFDFGLAYRARAENADAAWILKIHKTREESLVHELIVSASYGIPELCFNSYQSKVFSQEMVEGVFRSLPDQEARAARCLEDHGRKLAFPIYTTNNMSGYTSYTSMQQRQGRTTLFETQACNLIPGYMAIPIAPDHVAYDSRLARWETISIKTELYSGIVYSLDIEKHHKYVSDGLVTCNSIYAFAGASLRSMDEIIEAERPRICELPLSICYRCPTEVISFAATIRPGIEAAPGAPAGRVEHIDNSQVMELAQPGDLILCRLNAPLVEMCLSLLRAGKRATVRGMDLGQRFEGLMERIVAFYQKKRDPGFTNAQFYQHLIPCVDDYRSEEIAILGENEEENEERLVQLEDNLSTLEALYEGHRREIIFPDRKESFPLDFNGFLAFIKHFFKEDKEAQIILSTGHKAKGLEFPVVFILSWNRLPHSRAITEEALKQERNLMYVMATRVLFDKNNPRSGILYLGYDRQPEDEEERDRDDTSGYNQVTSPTFDDIADLVAYLRWTGWKRLSAPDDDPLVFGGRSDPESNPVMLSLPATLSHQDALPRITAVIEEIASIDGVATDKVVQQILDYRNGKVSCLCGSSLRVLHEAFGPELTGHIVDCLDCEGKRSMHVSPSWRKCLSCGCYTDLRVIEPAFVPELEAPVVEQSDAGSTDVPVEQSGVTGKKAKKTESSGEEPKKVGLPKKGKGRTRMNCSFDLDVAAF